MCSPFSISNSIRSQTMRSDFQEYIKHVEALLCRSHGTKETTFRWQSCEKEKKRNKTGLRKVRCTREKRKCVKQENDPRYTWAQILFLSLFWCFCQRCGFELNRKESCMQHVQCICMCRYFSRGKYQYPHYNKQTKKKKSQAF